MDFLTRMRIREIVLLGLIALTTVLYNLPPELVDEKLGINRAVLLGVLFAAVIIGLFLYLKFFFFFAVMLLIAGANTPETIAEGLNISRLPLILALVALVGMSLINHVVKLMPTGLEPKPKQRSAEGVRALFYAIEKNNSVYAQKVLSMNFDPDVLHENGYTPIAYAAMKGNPQMVETLLRNGANPTTPTRDGDTPVELALRMGHTEIADILKRARQAGQPGESDAPGALPQPQAS